jgi:chemotaxis protein methyltransferase CheR
MTPLPPPAVSSFLRKLVFDCSAIVLDERKDYLLQARLGPLLDREGLRSWDDLVDKLHAPFALGLRQRVIEAMTTHETSFFRDQHPFDALRAHVFPRLFTERPRGTINVWSAAASSGQEIYSIAFLATEMAAARDVQFRLLATDISAEILGRAREGRFSQLEVNRGLPAPQLVRHFERNGLEWRVKEPIRRLIDFRLLNLIEPWPPVPDMDVVFLRNVLIYFDVPTKRRILERLASVMRPRAILFLGAVESTLNLCDRFLPITLGKAMAFERLA